jgi:hypothetical protein
LAAWVILREPTLHIAAVCAFLDGLNPNVVRVELCADGVVSISPVLKVMKRVCQLTDVSGGYVYSAAASAARPPENDTVRAIAHCEGISTHWKPHKCYGCADLVGGFLRNITRISILGCDRPP